MKLPEYLLSPLPYAVILAIGLAWGWQRLPKALRRIGMALEVLLVVAMMPLGANALVWSVESRTPSAAACREPTPRTIVLLSGGVNRNPRSASDYAALTRSSLQRLFAAVALWRRTPNARLVIAGGGHRTPDSILLAGLAERLGVPASALETERRSRTTWENAMYVAELEPKLPQRIWLVSSALHLPRALGAFRAWGFEPCAWPSGSMHVPFGLNPGYFIPQSSSLAKADLAIHEWVGEMVYAGLEWKLRRTEQNISGQAAPAKQKISPPA